MSKLTPMQKLEKITDEWIDGKRYKNLLPLKWMHFWLCMKPLRTKEGLL